MRKLEDTLDDGITFDEYHRDQLAQYTGFEPKYKGTNFDKFISYIDDVHFSRMGRMEEVAKAREIAYAHGLELDDIGDVLGVTRDGYDDDVYRFLLYSHNLARNSKGTHNDLLRIAARMIGCDPTDIVLKPDRHYDSTGQLVGKPRTLNIVDIAYSKVKNLFLLDRLASELERSAAAGTKINFVNLSVPIESSIFVGTDVQVMEEINI
ncbi:hypothetical protein [Levilactobacillus andaensis]|uniref:hypothetical protein n=1 Tax=Levilactobacillus andaensis TaxID=2799570 RepID=UPI001942D4DF|nr:hypothetical protein [Levilactobacillus andaensis]